MRQANQGEGPRRRADRRRGRTSSPPRARIIASPAPPAAHRPPELSSPCQALYGHARVPIPVTGFIGRAAAKADVLRLLQAHRLLTLTGPGGCGKTRLAIETASVVAETFPDGVYWVDLSTLTDPGLVAQTVARMLGLHEQPEQTWPAVLVAHLQPCRLVLILDNCEHLLAACADLVHTLLTHCPYLHILATSREALGMGGESIYPVPPLSTPTAEVNGSPNGLLEYEGVRLFVTRATAVYPQFHLTPDTASSVAYICRHLDGLPLALELAAARVRTLTVQQLASHLADTFNLLTDGNRTALPRQQTLINLMNWSYQLLTPAEQACLRRLAVFCGGWTREAAEAVCAGDGLAQTHIFDLLGQLVGKSLVSPPEAGSSRYHFLETIRQYAAHQLEDAREAEAARRQHAQTYLALVRQAEPELQGADQSTWLDRLEVEHDNLRAALDWALEQGEGAVALAMAAGLWRFWEARGYMTEGRHWLDRALAATAGDTSILRARALDGAGVLAHNQSDYPSAAQLYQASLALKSALGDEVGVTRVLNNLGTLAKDRGEPARAELLYTDSLSRAQRLDHPLLAAQALLNLGVLFLAQGQYRRATTILQDSVPLFRRAGDERGLALALSNLGLAARNMGDYPRSLVLHEEALSLRQRLADKVGIAFSLANLGLLAQDQADFSRGAACQEDALALFRELGNRWGEALLLATLALDALYQDQVTRARKLAAESLALYRDLDHHWGIAMALNTLALIAQHVGDDRAEGLARESLALRRDIHDQHGIVECLEALAVAAARQDAPETALRLDGAASAIREAIGAPRSPAEQAYFGPRLARPRQALDERTANEVWRTGHALSLAQAVDDALRLDSPPVETAPTVTPPAVAPSAAPANNHATPNVRIFGLGQSRVYRGDQLLTSADWTYAKPKELLFFLLSRGVRTKEQIGVMLWPEASAAQLRTSFHPTLYHVRRSLGGNEWVLARRDGYTFNRSLPYTYDVETFEAHVAEAGRARESDPARAIQQLQAAVQLYQGDFLEDMSAESEWLLLRREELAHLYEDALLSLADLLLAAGRAAEAADAYRRVIAHDNLLEAAHRGLLRCYGRQAERGQAIRHYQGLVTLLEREVGGEPAPETKALFERITRGEEV